MKETYSIYIVDKIGKPLYVRERYIQGSEEAENTLFPFILDNIKKLLLKIENNEENIINLPNSKIYFDKDELKDVFFMIKTDFDAKNKKVFKILRQVKELFTIIFSNILKINDLDRVKLLIDFQEKLEKIVGVNI